MDGVEKQIGVQRFGQIVVSTLTQAIQSDIKVGCAGDHDDTEVGIRMGEILNDFVAVFVWEANIKDGKSYFPVFKQGKQFGRVGRGMNIKAVLF